MSRIGKAPITVPAGVDVKLDGRNISVKGPKGTLSLDRHDDARRYGVAWAGFQPDTTPLQFLTENAVRQGNWTDVVTRCDQWLTLAPAATTARIAREGPSRRVM